MSTNRSADETSPVGYGQQVSAPGAEEAQRSRALFAATFGLWFASVLTLVAGLLRGKVSALYLGPEGMGLVAQLSFLVNFATNFAALGLSNGCIKLLAEARAQSDVQAERRVRGILFALPVGLGLLIALALSLVAQPASDLLLGNQSSATAIAIATIGVPLAMASGSFSIALQGAGKMRRLATVNSLSTVLATTMLVCLVILFGIHGAVAGIALVPLVTLLCFVLGEPRFAEKIDLRPRLLLHRPTLRAIYGFGVASIVLSFCSSGLDLGLRTAIVHQLGIASNGLYQPVVALSTQFFLALVTAVSIYLFPRLTELYTLGKEAHAESEVNEGLRLILAILVPTIVVVVTFAPNLLALTFSQSFEKAAMPLNIQMLGDLFRALGWIFGAVLLPLGLIRSWLWVGVATITVQGCASLALLPPFGLEGLALGYSVAWAVNVAATLWVINRLTPFRVDRRSKVFAGAAIVTCSLMVLSVYGGTTIKMLTAFAVLILWWAITLRRDTFRPVVIRLRGSG